MTKRVLFVNDLAELLNTSPASVRSHLQRRNFHAIPKPIFLGNRVAWTFRQVELFLEQKELESAGGMLGVDEGINLSARGVKEPKRRIAMHSYRIQKTLLGLPLSIAVLYDAQNVQEAFFEGVIAKLKGMGARVSAYAFTPRGESNDKLKQVALDIGIQVIGVKVRRSGDEAVDKKVFQWIGRIEGAGKDNVIAVASTDKGYLLSKEDVRSENRALIAFGHGRLSEKCMRRYDLYYDLTEMKFHALGDKWGASERLELLILLRIAMSEAYKAKGWSLSRDVEEFFDRFNPDWKRITGCNSVNELAESLGRFIFKGGGKKESWIRERYL